MKEFLLDLLPIIIGVLIGLAMVAVVESLAKPEPVTVIINQQPAQAAPKRHPSSAEFRDCINAIPTKISADELGKRIDACGGAR